MLALVAAPGVAGAQTGIQVAPVLVNLSPERSISSVRIRNGREEPISFEVDAYAWTQVNGEDVLTPTTDLIVAPAVFEISADGEQTLRLGTRAANPNSESAYRIVLRELPNPHRSGVALGFTLEMSMPVFVTPRGAHSDVTTQVEQDRIVLTNTGASYAQISLMNGEQRVPSPRYLLAGTTVEVEAPQGAQQVQLIAAGAGGASNPRVIHVGRSDQHASVR